MDEHTYPNDLIVDEPSPLRSGTLPNISTMTVVYGGPEYFNHILGDHHMGMTLEEYQALHDSPTDSTSHQNDKLDAPGCGFCPDCGAKVPLSGRFCIECGAPLTHD